MVWTIAGCVEGMVRLHLRPRVRQSLDHSREYVHFGHGKGLGEQIAGARAADRGGN
jgi:hypothetical protein